MENFLSDELDLRPYARKFDTFRNKITWFGFKLHIAVDTESELPVVLNVMPAHVNDGDMGPELILKTYVFLNAIVLLASALFVKRTQQAENKAHNEQVAYY